PWDEMRTGLLAAGFVRALGPDGMVDLEGAAAPPARDGRLTIVQDRLGLRAPDHGRLVESLEQALRHGRGRAAVRLPDAGDRVERFSTALECAACGFAVRDPVPNLFSFNSPLGACETCRGFGRVIDLDLDLVVPDPRRSPPVRAVKPEALDFRVGGLTIADVSRLPIGEAEHFFAGLALPAGQGAEVAGLILGEIRSRLRYLVEVGLEYLTLDRQSRTLSGGELERV